MELDCATGHPLHSLTSDRQNTIVTLGSSAEESVMCRAIVPYAPPAFAHFFSNSKSGNNNCTSVSKGGIAAEISVSTAGNPPKDLLDLEPDEDPDVPTVQVSFRMTRY